MRSTHITTIAMVTCTAALILHTGAAAATPLDTGLSALQRQADADPAATAGVAALAESARKVNSSGSYAPFVYSSPTLGCGSGNGPFTLTGFSGMGEEAGPGRVSFQASPAYSGVPSSSTLSIAWVNLRTGARGITPVDDTTDYHLPSLSTTVHTGTGTVVASLWGTVNYTDAICRVQPTVGTFTVD